MPPVVLLIFLSILFLAYALLVVYYWYLWYRIPVFAPKQSVPSPTFSIIIPARNEEGNIGILLKALQQQTYPAHLCEVIVVDDHSDDDTAVVVQQFPGVRLIKADEGTSHAYKKKAIETGIAAATGEWIVTTDADCIPPANWLQAMALFIQERNPVFVAAPVVMQGQTPVLELFQVMDFMVLQAITGGVVNNGLLTMCNGANIAYRRDAFYAVHGFEGIDAIASGDDMLLMYKIEKAFPGKTMYLKSTEAIVETAPQPSWRSFFNQRIRWASKARKYDDKRFLPVLLLVYLMNLVFPVLLVAGIFHPRYWTMLAVLWLSKTLVELPLFRSAALFFNRGCTLKWFFFFQPLHIIYTILSGFLGQIGSYEWKGRRVH